MHIDIHTGSGWATFCKCLTLSQITLTGEPPYNPYRALISSMRSIGFLDALRNSSSMIISGISYSMHRYSFSSVFSFICGQSLQAQLLLGGAGMKVLCGDDFCI